MPRLLVTGASGHLGASLVRDLHAHGYETVSLARAKSDRRGLVGTGTVIADGDLLDRGSIERALDGCDGVIHAGAVHRNAAHDPDEMLKPTVEGTRNVIEAAAARKIRRVVHCSSNATVGYGQTDEPLDETSFLRDPKSTYIRSKVESERIAMALGPERGVEVVVVNPCGILGPWDLRITPTTKAIVDMCNGAPVVIDVSLTHVLDIAAGHRLAWEKGVPGERYVLAGDPGPREEIARTMTEILGRKVGVIRPPYAVVWLLAAAQEARFALGGAEPDITRATLQDLGPAGRLLYSAAKARRDLGWTARPLHAVLEDTVRWIAHRGLVKGALGDALRARLPPDADWPAA